MPTPLFPAPEVIAGRNYWSRGAIRRWRAENANQPMPEARSDDDMLMNARQVRELFGNVSDMWLHRRRHGLATGGEAA